MYEVPSYPLAFLPPLGVCAGGEGDLPLFLEAFDFFGFSSQVTYSSYVMFISLGCGEKSEEYLREI